MTIFNFPLIPLNLFCEEEHIELKTFPVRVINSSVGLSIGTAPFVVGVDNLEFPLFWNIVDGRRVMRR